jgi:hypothetical protein
MESDMNAFLGTAAPARSGRQAVQDDEMMREFEKMAAAPSAPVLTREQRAAAEKRKNAVK